MLVQPVYVIPIRDDGWDVIFRLVGPEYLRRNSKKLVETDPGTEHDAADQTPWRTAEHEAGKPADAEHKDDRTKEHNARRPCKAASPQSLIGRIGLERRRDEIVFRGTLSFSVFLIGSWLVEQVVNHRQSLGLVTPLIMTVSAGDFNSYLMPRQVIRRESRAAMQLNRKTAGVRIQSVFWAKYWRRSAAA